jgi:hypothetical protein
MKAKWLSFTIAYFLESGLFNELRPIQIKKFLAPSLGLCTTSVLSPRATPPTPSLTRPMAIVVPQILNFGKKTQLQNLAAGRPMSVMSLKRRPRG